jgi:2-dehydropantoate 2-reductase
MKIAVMGAGAVGCYYGGLLARAGHEVTLVGRPALVEAVSANGLHLESAAFDGQVKLKAAADASGVAGAELVLVCVKSPDTEDAARAMAPHLAPDAIVLSLQNGVDNADRLRLHLSQPVWPAVVYVATGMAGPGHVRHFGRGELVIDEDTSLDAIARQLVAAGIPIERSGNVPGALWTKLVANCAWNAMSAITQLSYGQLFAGHAEATLGDVTDECLAVAKAAGVTMPGDTWASVLRIADTMPGQHSSTAQDLARGKPSEIDHLNGYVMRRGEGLGVPTPVNRLLHRLVRLLEDKAKAGR